MPAAPPDRRDRHRIRRTRAVAVVAAALAGLLLAGTTGITAAWAEGATPTPGPAAQASTAPPVGGAAETPAAPVAPPLDDPAAGAGSDKCSPGSDEVVRVKPAAQLRLAPERAWDLTQGSGVTVAVVDTGVQASAPQLAGRVRAGFDVVNRSGPGNTDCNGHGTFVAGIIAAQPVKGVGFAGVAPGASILPIRQSNTDTDGTAGGLATAIRLAVEAGARVVNVSSSSFFDSADLRAAVDFAVRRDVLVVAAVGNEAQEGNAKSFPASYPGVLAVGAVGLDDKRTDFSETGDFVDVVAPGVDVVSLAVRGRGHLVGQGTSFATPYVAGVAALVRAYHPALTVAQVTKRLQVTADHPGTAVPDKEVGFGVVNPMAAVSSVIPGEVAGAGAAPPAAERIPLAGPLPGRDTRGRTVALGIAGVGIGIALLTALVAVTVPRGRRRGWRPAGTQP
jgi:membrane-anchored mycosin MYCP